MSLAKTPNTNPASGTSGNTHKNRQARIYALKFLFQLPFHKREEWEHAYRLYSETLGQEDYLRPQNQALIYGQNIILGVMGRYKEINEMVEKFLNRSPMHLSKVDHAILLMSLYEIMFAPQTPRNVIINEAIELCKMFSSKESSSLINGLLDHFHRPESSTHAEHVHEQENENDTNIEMFHS